MRFRSVTCLVASLALVPAGIRPALAHYDERDAARDCERAVIDEYGHQEIYGERLEETGSDSYDMSGKVRVRNGGDRDFTCRIKHREVVSVRLRDGSDKKDDDNFSVGTAAAVGAGVIGLAAIAALAGAGDDHAKKRSGYQSDIDSDPLADRNYLEEECRSNLVSHLQQEHGSVERLRLGHAYLDERDLRGEGEVQFRVGGSREIEFTCEFDRRGRIYDGSYRYY